MSSFANFFSFDTGEVYVGFLHLFVVIFIFLFTRMPKLGFVACVLWMLFLFPTFELVTPDDYDIDALVMTFYFFIVLQGVGAIMCLDKIWPCEKLRKFKFRDMDIKKFFQ